jgi:hypothetical protein
MRTSPSLRRQSAADESEAKSHSRRTRISEIAISGLIAVVLLIAVVSALPDSSIKETLAGTLAPIAKVSGLDQGWAMFSPDPPRVVTDVEVQVAMTNGEVRKWKFDTDRSLLGSFHWDRWRKLKEQVIKEEVIRPAFAHWVASKLKKPNELPMRVIIVIDIQSLPAPGTDGPTNRERKLLYDWKSTATK